MFNKLEITMLDPTSDMLTRIRNAQMAKKAVVRIPASKLKIAIANILAQEGFVESFRVDKEDGTQGSIEITLKYIQHSAVDKEPMIKGIVQKSRQGQRMYVRKEAIRRVRNGYGIGVFSTSRGVLTGEKARELGVGGEYICEVW
jgi:small subunit ribosomal protein S8